MTAIPSCVMCHAVMNVSKSSYNNLMILMLYFFACLDFNWLVYSGFMF